jgi:foldase protein PrsA
MKECPNCNKKYSDDQVYCLEDGTVLEAMEKASEAETVELSAEEIPETVVVKEDDVKTEVLEAKETIKAEEAKPTVKVAAASSGGGGMSSTAKFTVLLGVIFLAGISLLVWKVKVGGQSEGLTKLSKADMEMIFKDMPPMALKRLAEDPEAKKKQIEGIKQFLAVAEEARTSGFANKEEYKVELENIGRETLALNYDKEKNKDKENLPPLSAITKEDVEAYYQKNDNAAKFNKYIEEQIKKAQDAGRIPKDFKLQPEQEEQAKDQFAKVRIYADEAKAKWNNLSEEFRHNTELQIKLEKAQFLVQAYSKDVISKKIAATNEDVAKYLQEHPDEDPKGEIKKYLDENPTLTKEQKKAKAEDLLKRAKAGEDFAKLAEEFSQDPGSQKDGGLYKDVKKGGMVPEFEKTSLGLEPGQIADALVESKYGYHIIKLERKGMTKGPDGKEEETYDARHILIKLEDDEQTPASPIKQKIESERAKKLVEEIAAKHKIEVAEDFEIKVPEIPEGQNPPGMPPTGNNPQISEEQMKQLQKQIEEAQKKAKDSPKKSDKDGKQK